MRVVDPFVQLKQFPNTSNVLKFIESMSSDRLEISESDIEDLFDALHNDFELNHSSVKEFDNALWQKLETVDISVDWIEVILAYGKNDLPEQKPRLEIVAADQEKMRTAVQDAINEYAQPINSLTPRSFQRIEEIYQNNSFITTLQNDREKLISVLWDLYRFSPKSRKVPPKVNASIDWDLFFRLITFVYKSLLEKATENKENANDITNDRSVEFDSIIFEEKGIAVSTLLFLSPTACSRRYEKYSDFLSEFASKQLGENPLNGLFKLFNLGNLNRIKIEETRTHESLWLLPNLVSILSVFFGSFLNEKKFYQLLLAYTDSAYETDHAGFPNGAAKDYENLVSNLIRFIVPDYITAADISKLLNAFNIDQSETELISKKISENRSKLLNIDSISFLLSEVIFDSLLEEFDIERHLENRFLAALDNSNRIPRRVGLWAADDVAHFEGITYRRGYYKSSRSLIAATCTFYGLDDDPVSLAIDGAESLVSEGFHKLGLTYLSYNLLDFIANVAYGSEKGLLPSTHRKLAKLLPSLKLEKTINAAYFQILSFCATQKDLFGPLFCEVLDSSISDFKFENVVQLKLAEPSDLVEYAEDRQSYYPKDLGSWASSDANESFKKICKEIATIKVQPADGVWERKYKMIRGNVDELLVEIDQVCTTAFKNFYYSSLEDFKKVNEGKFIDFQDKFDQTRKVTFGTITKYYFEIKKIKDQSEHSVVELKNIFEDKKCFNMLKIFSEEHELIASLSHLCDLRNSYRHKSMRLKWVSVRRIVDFAAFEIDDFLQIFK
jgi:hypothetical protein